MKSTLGRRLSVSLIALLVLSVMTVSPTFYGGTSRTFPGPGAGAATFYVTPVYNNYTSPPLKTGTTFTVQVRIANATHVASWQVELSYNKNYLNTVAANCSYAADMIFPPGTYSPIPPIIDAENATHNYVLMTATTNGAVEYDSGVWPLSKGLISVVFKIIADPPAGVGNKLWSSLRLERPGVFGCFVLDTDLYDNDLTVIDGYYENAYAYVPPSAAYLEISPAVKNMPVIDGDKIVGTPRAFFDLDILINLVNPADELFFVQLNVSWNPALLDLIDIEDGPFMNNPIWSPHGADGNTTVKEPGGFATYWIMINPNDTGYWDNTAWPSGDGVVGIAHFEVISQSADADGVAPAGFVTSPVDLQGVFGEFFLGHPNDAHALAGLEAQCKDPPNDADPPYLPYGDPVNGVVNIYDYYWKAPVAIKTHTPDIPLVGETVIFDGSASRGYRNVDGAMVPDATYIASYFWTYGDGSNSSVGPITTHVYADTGAFTVTLTVTDLDGRIGSVSQPVTVISGRLIDVFVGTGTGPYPTPYGGQGQDNVADMFEPQETVCVYALVTYNGDPVQSKLVTFIVVSPHNLHDFSRTAITNGTGYAYIEFGLPWPCEDPVNEIFGIWNITVKVDIRGQVVEDTIAFKVWWLIEVTSVVPEETEYVKGTTAGFDVYFRTYRMQPIDTVVEITVFDDLNVPLGAARIQLDGIGWGNYTWCVFKEYNIRLSIDIPEWAFVGTGTAYVNAFHVDPTNPYNMGSPYCPEAFATFRILKTP